MGTSAALLLHNGIYAGIVLFLALVAIVLGAALVLRLGALFLGSRLFADASELKAAFARKVWRSALGLSVLVGLLLTAGLLLVTRRGVHLGDWLRSAIAQLHDRDWSGLGLLTARALGVLLLALLAARLVRTLLLYARDRLHRSEALSGHRERLTELIDHLRRALTTGILFGTLIFCAHSLSIRETGQSILRGLAYIAVAYFTARFLVGAAHLVIDVLFDLSESLSKLESPVRYLGRFRHLGKLTKRTADYSIYVGIATWTVERLTPGTAVVQTGRTALRILAIFYLSRVLTEVCALFLNEFFLSREDRSEAEQQQRQTLVPVAAGLLRYGIYFTAVVMSLREAGFDPTPLLAGAGIAGVAIGLGAQSFVGDLVAGFFILFEHLFLVGDFIEIGEVKGKVEAIGVRVTRIRDEAGILHAVPNGEVRKVSSHSKGYVNAVVDLLVPYEENLHRIFDLLNKKMAALRAQHADIIGPTEFAIEEMKESAVQLRTVTMVKPGTAQEMTNVLRLAFWEVLRMARVPAPHARRLVLAPPQPSAESPAQDLRGAPVTYSSDIQKIKAYNLYLALDVNDSGHLDHSDIEALGRRLIENQHRDPDPAVRAELLRRLEAYWQDLVSRVDYDHDGHVSREEYLEFCAAVSRDFAGKAGESMRALADVLFSVCDKNGNETLSESEFVQWGCAYGLADAVATAGFNLIDRDRNGRITRAEWQRFIRDVFLSQKLNDAAAVVFGPGCRAARPDDDL